MFLGCHSNMPINKMINIYLFQFPYILTQFSILLTRFTSERSFIVIVIFFKSIFTSTIVIFISSCTKRSFENKAFRKRVTTHGRVYFWTAVASFGGRWCWIFYNFKIVFPDEIVHVRHTTLTGFDVISVE